MPNVNQLVTTITRQAHAKGGRSKAHEVTVAQAAELTKYLLQALAHLPACEVGMLLAKYRRRK